MKPEDNYESNRPGRGDVMVDDKEMDLLSIDHLDDIHIGTYTYTIGPHEITSGIVIVGRNETISLPKESALKLAEFITETMQP